jgi:hypothetical protein
VVAEGRLLIVELNGFGLWWMHSDRIGSRMEVVLGMLMDALVLSAVIGTQGIMVAMLVAASELCG